MIILYSLYLISFNKILAADTNSTPRLTNPLKSDNLPELIGYLIQALLGIVGSLALVMFIYGGIMWLTSGGNPDQVKKGKQTIIWAIMGLVVIFSAYAILRFVFTVLS